MAVGPVEPFKIESESEADDYLRDLLTHPEYRSMSEVRRRAQALIEDSVLRDYFVSKAKAVLQMKRTVYGFDITWAGDSLLHVTRLSHAYEFTTSPDGKRLEKHYSTSPVDVAKGDPLDDARRFEDDAREAAREYLRLQSET